MVLGKQDSDMQKNEIRHFLTPYTKINSKWIKDLNVRPETIKLLEENIGRKLDNIHQSKIFYYPPPRLMEIKTKINKWAYLNSPTYTTAGSSMTHLPEYWK